MDTTATNCRICLNDSAEQYISIYDDILSVQISVLIQEISNSPICLSDQLSTLICTKCCTDLQKAIRVRRLFLRSEEYFLKLINNNTEPPFLDANSDDPFLLHNVDIEFVEKPDDVDIKVEDFKQNTSDDYIECNDGDVVDKIKNEEDEEMEIVLSKEITLKTEIVSTHVKTELLKKAYELPKSLTVRKLPSKERPTSAVQYLSFKELTWADLGEKEFTKKATPIRNEIYIGRNVVEIDRTSVFKISKERLKYSCCMCYQLSETEEELIAHLYTHPDRAKRSEFQKNIAQAYPSGGQTHQYAKKKCIKCLRTFSIGNFDIHLKEIYAEKKFLCECCGMCFGFYKKMKAHERNCRMKMYEQPQKYTCDVCQKICNNRHAIVQHLKLHNVTEEDRTKFKCNICGHGLPTLRFLKSHVQQHSTIKSKNCTLCEKTFRTGNQLKSHLRVHNNDRIFQCRFCEKNYIHTTDMRRHEMTVHTGERPHKCEFCEKGFVKKYSLKMHRKQNHGMD